MQMVRGEKRYAVIAVDGDVLTLANRYGAAFAVEISTLIANGYCLECATDEAMPDGWPDETRVAAPKDAAVKISSEPGREKDIFKNLFDF
ncbi:hypothetical protein ACJU26_05345 [Acidithiobacillus sp. M4-SHS-6]|uniref:hypothetical protein n=1 Tax=Acidithiobacillus sp. M4-SHS-6 TaxID=3383024 RepID=UPI0039BE10A2